MITGLVALYGIDGSVSLLGNLCSLSLPVPGMNWRQHGITCAM